MVVDWLYWFCTDELESGTRRRRQICRAQERTQRPIALRALDQQVVVLAKPSGKRCLVVLVSVLQAPPSGKMLCTCDPCGSGRAGRFLKTQLVPGLHELVQPHRGWLRRAAACSTVLSRASAVMAIDICFGSDRHSRREGRINRSTFLASGFL